MFQVRGGVSCLAHPQKTQLRKAVSNLKLSWRSAILYSNVKECVLFRLSGEGDKFKMDPGKANGGGGNAQLAARGTTSTQEFYHHRDRLRYGRAA